MREEGSEEDSQPTFSVCKRHGCVPGSSAGKRRLLHDGHVVWTDGEDQSDSATGGDHRYGSDELGLVEGEKRF